jgi:hypothetical protein
MCPITGSMAEPASQLAFDSAKDAALLTRDEDTAWMRGIVARISLSGVGALALMAGELLGIFDDRSQAIIRIAGQRSGVQHELAAGSAGVSRDDRDFDADLVRGKDLSNAGGVSGNSRNKDQSESDKLYILSDISNSR